MRQPTTEEIRDIAAESGLQPTEEELSYLRRRIAGTVADDYARIDELAAPQPNAVRSERPPGRRPPATENPLNAVVTRCAVRRSDGGPLAGIDVGLKDNIALAGVEMTCGSRQLRGYVPSSDATVTTRLLDASGTVVAKLNMDSLASAGTGASSDFGPVLNPMDSDHLAGGSSSGCAAAVANGTVDVAIGTDQGGSIRHPASWSGCVGLKPTYGLVPYTGIASLTPSMDHVGPMARSVHECALALAVLAGVDGLDPRQGSIRTGSYVDAATADVDGMTIGVLRQGFASPDLDPAVEKRVRTAIRRVVDRGASVTEVSVPMHSDGTAVWTGIFTEEVVNVLENAGLGYPGRGVYDTEFGRVFTDAVGTSPNDLPKPMKYFLVLGSYVAERDAHRYYAKAQNLRRVLAAAYDDALADVDVLAMPTTLYTAVRVQEDAILDTPNLNANTSPFDATGHPSVSVPCGDVDGLPVGLMLVGKQFDDATVLRAARAVETVTGD